MTTIIPPICFGCRHFNGDMTCTAFPDEIPEDIRMSRHDHREPYSGDNGIRFEPVDDEAAEIVARMFGDEQEPER